MKKCQDCRANYKNQIKMKLQLNRNEILERFGLFFKDTNQTIDEATINMTDLEAMDDNQLLTIYKAFDL